MRPSLWVFLGAKIHQLYSLSTISGVAGGVVQSTYFQIKFGLRPAEGPVKQSHIDDVSANVVSALQGGAFFGALSSAPVSGGFFGFSSSV